jgi:hypothetical protein
MASQLAKHKREVAQCASKPDSSLDGTTFAVCSAAHAALSDKRTDPAHAPDGFRSGAPAYLIPNTGIAIASRHRVRRSARLAGTRSTVRIGSTRAGGSRNVRHRTDATQARRYSNEDAVTQILDAFIVVSRKPADESSTGVEKLCEVT